MLLKLSYKYAGVEEKIETTCSNYTFGLPKVFSLFHKKHPEGMNTLKKAGIVTDVLIEAYYNDRWRVLSSFSYEFK